MPDVSHDRYGYQIDPDLDGDAKRLLHMYPEPGLRETFTKGVMPIKSVKPVKKEAQRKSMEDPFLKSHRSTRTKMPQEAMDLAVHYAEGREPSYGRIMGLCQRLDKSVRGKMQAAS